MGIGNSCQELLQWVEEIRTGRVKRPQISRHNSASRQALEIRHNPLQACGFRIKSFPVHLSGIQPAHRQLELSTKYS